MKKDRRRRDYYQQVEDGKAKNDYTNAFLNHSDSATGKDQPASHQTKESIERQEASRWRAILQNGNNGDHYDLHGNYGESFL